MMRGLDHGVPNEGILDPRSTCLRVAVGFRISDTLSAIPCLQLEQHAHRNTGAVSRYSRSSPRARARHAPPSMCPAPAATPQSQSAHTSVTNESRNGTSVGPCRVRQRAGRGRRASALAPPPTGRRIRRWLWHAPRAPRPRRARRSSWRGRRRGRRGRRRRRARRRGGRRGSRCSSARRRCGPGGGEGA